MRRVLDYLRSSEGIILVTTIVLCCAITARNPAFLQAQNLLDLVRNSITTGLFAMGVYIALLSGGIDVSFTAVGAFAMYTTVKIFVQVAPGAPFALILLTGAIVGALLGAFNGTLIAYLRLPTLIVTLGTLNLFRGFMLTYIGSQHVTELPASMQTLSRTYLYRGRLADGSLFSLPATTLILIAVILLVAFFVRYTMFGRAVYAIGGNEVAATRLGLPVARIKFLIYVLVGTIAGITGIVHSVQFRVANPFDLVGQELNVLAAVVLGGTQITGGRGSVFGTILGVFLVTVINNSLILIGVSSQWEKFVIGTLVILGAGTPWLFQRFSRRHS